jgi:hypothetical protein
VQLIRLHDRLLLGDNPFTGVDHLDQSRAAGRKAGLEDALGVMKSSAAAGATGFSFSIHPLNSRLVEAFEKEGGGFSYYPVFPYAYRYVRLASEKGSPALLEDMVSKLGFFGTLKAGIGLASADPVALLKAALDMEIRPLARLFGKQKLGAVFLHELIVDLCIGLDVKEPIASYLSHVGENYGKAGLVTRNFPLLLQKLGEWELAADAIMAPFNMAGFQMVPSREACEKALSSLPDKTAVMAISPMAAGLIKPAEALPYIASLQRIDAVILGTSSPAHAKETFTFAKSLFYREPNK